MSESCSAEWLAGYHAGRADADAQIQELRRLLNSPQSFAQVDARGQFLPAQPSVFGGLQPVCGGR